MSRVAVFSEGVPGIGGKGVEYADGKLTLEGTSRVIDPVQLDQMIAAGRAKWEPGQPMAMSLPAQPNLEPEPEPEPDTASKPGVSRIVLAIAVVVALLVGVGIGWLTEPYLMGTPAKAPSATTPAVATDTAAVPETVTVTPQDPTEFSVDSTSTKAKENPVKVSGYIKGYSGAASGVFLVYGKSGEVIPIAYNEKTAFSVAGKSVGVAEYVAAAATKDGSKASTFEVSQIASADEVIPSNDESITVIVPAASVKLYATKVSVG